MVMLTRTRRAARDHDSDRAAGGGRREGGVPACKVWQERCWDVRKVGCLKRWTVKGLQACRARVQVVVVHRHGDRTPISTKVGSFQQTPELLHFWHSRCVLVRGTRARACARAFVCV